MFNKNTWFSLVELIVWITVSMLLMISVWVFVTTWIKNITLQQKILSESQDSNDILSFVNKVFFDAEKLVFSNSSWVLLKHKPSFDRWPYSFVWEKTQVWTYCSSGETTITKHLFVKTFLPFEEIWEDIFSDFSSILTWSLVWNYVSDTLNHQITKDWTVIVWKGLVWESFDYGTSGTWFLINSPTWIALVNSNLIFSDTFNNRILYLSGWLVYELISEEAWLSEPTWLFYDSAWNRLFIANSGKWEILELSSPTTSKKLDLSFIIPKDTNNLKSLEFSFAWNIVTSTTSTWVFTFSWILKNANDTLDLSSDKITYSFSWSAYNQNISSWSLINISTSSDINFSSISNKSYYVNLKIIWDQVYEKNFPFFTNWDNNIFTKEDNILKILTWWLAYPTGISYSWSNITFNEFETRKQKIVDLNWNFVSEVNLTGFSVSNFVWLWENNLTDNYSIFPIIWADFSYNSNLLNLKLDYYKYLNCFNLDENIKKEYYLKKSF